MPATNYLCLMSELTPPGNRGFKFSKLFEYFLQGLLVMAPIAITIYAVYWIISSIDNLIPLFTEKGLDGKVYVRNYGLGFVIIIATIVIIGYLSSFFIRIKVFSLFDSWLEKAPGIRYIYSTVRDFFEAFAGEKKKFNKAVLANIDDTDVWRVGFLTQEDMSDFGFHNYVTVYIPMSYSIAGNIYLIPKERVKPITNIGPSDAMKFAISGGVTKVDDEKLHLNEGV